MSVLPFDLMASEETKMMVAILEKNSLEVLLTPFL